MKITLLFLTGILAYYLSLSSTKTIAIILWVMVCFLLFRLAFNKINDKD